MLKNNIVALMISLSLSMPVYAEEAAAPNNVEPSNADAEVLDVPTQIRLTPLQEEASTLEDSQNGYDTIQKEEELTNTIYKKPVSKKRIAKKFILAMLGVVASSLIIYVLLTIYNRFRDMVIVNKSGSLKESSLLTPNDQDSAVRSFLDKTKWE